MKVQLFNTCLTEQFFPQVLEKMKFLLRKNDIEVFIPRDQTCCGQALYNSGFQKDARLLAKHWLDVFGRKDDFIVSPSGSCVDMVRKHYMELFDKNSKEFILLNEVTKRTFEFTEFFSQIIGNRDLKSTFSSKVTYHASCHLLRGLGVREQPKNLLRLVNNLELIKMEEEDVCCGFGGIFSVIYPEISQAMMDRKLTNIVKTGADVVTACDAGCLMNIGGGLKKNGSQIRALHIIEILAADGSE